MKRQIENGDVILDGTLTRYEKEKIAFATLGQVEDILEKYHLDSVEDLAKILEIYKDIYKNCNKGNWVTIRNGKFISCVVNNDLGAKEFQWRKV